MGQFIQRKNLDHPLALLKEVTGCDGEWRPISSIVGGQDKSEVVNSVAPVTPSRRAELRLDCREICEYEVFDANCWDAGLLERGQAVALNRSEGGILLLIPRAVLVTQLVEVQMDLSRRGHVSGIYEVRWMRPIRVKATSYLYLLGARLVFGPCQALSV